MFDAYIDNSGETQERYREPQLLDSYNFVLCTRGECHVNIYTSDYTIRANNIVTLLPNSYFRVIDQSPDTELYIVSFSQRILTSADIFAIVLEHITHIIENPVIEFSPNVTEILCEYINLLRRVKGELRISENIEFVNSILKQFIIGIGSKHRVIEEKRTHIDRSRALVAELIRLVALHYVEERGVTFYASKMSVTPQHLSSVVRRVTQRTITDIIAMFVIIDAQTKLFSTDLTIGEISAALHFDDISIFGRYFKRYTQLSPRQYRGRKR